MRERYGKQYVGVWHFAFWLMAGHPHKGPVVSSECTGLRNVLRQESVSQFLKGMVPFHQAAAMIFRLLDPAKCKHYKDSFEALARKYDSMHFIRRSPKTTFLGMAVPFQVRVLPHRDNADDKHGYVAMTNLGNYRGGDLIVGSDCMMFRFAYRPGQFVLMKSALLRHGVMPFEGERRALVGFSHEGVFEWI
jgi:hypothetical protein